VDSVQSITVTYNGSGDYVVATTNLDGSTGETAHFHYDGIIETATATPTATVVATVTSTATPVPIATSQLNTSGSYTIQSGDYLFKIAVLYDTSVQALALANDIANTDLIFIGQKLTIP
jgi:LysM repeat protein